MEKDWITHVVLRRLGVLQSTVGVRNIATGRGLGRPSLRAVGFFVVPFIDDISSKSFEIDIARYNMTQCNSGERTSSAC